MLIGNALPERSVFAKSSSLIMIIADCPPVANPSVFGSTIEPLASVTPLYLFIHKCMLRDTYT
jgi:hypothetical protein